jgi:hypothetical protein
LCVVIYQRYKLRRQIDDKELEDFAQLTGPEERLAASDRQNQDI